MNIDKEVVTFELDANEDLKVQSHLNEIMNIIYPPPKEGLRIGSPSYLTMPSPIQCSKMKKFFYMPMQFCSAHQDVHPSEVTVILKTPM